MSRSTKDAQLAARAQRIYPDYDQPGTEKAGSTRRPDLRGRSPRQSNLLGQRHGFGRTEKILRRNRKTWTRLFAKEGRRLDQVAIVEGLGS